MTMLQGWTRGIWQGWRGMTASDRIRLGLLALLVPVASVAAYAAFEASPDMAMLAESLDADTSRAITRYLDAHDVPYVTVDEGQTILVPASWRAEVTFESIRMRALQAARIDAGSVGEPPNPGTAARGGAS